MQHQAIEAIVDAVAGLQVIQETVQLSSMPCLLVSCLCTASFASYTSAVDIEDILNCLQGTLFLDYGTDLHSGARVPGDPAGMRGKPGNGYGVGAGIRVQTHFAPVRLEYAWNKEGRGRFHFRIGTI